MSVKSSKLMLEVLEGIVPSRPPFWFMRQAGRYLPEYLRIRNQASNFLELCLTPSLASTLSLQPVTRFHTDAAILFSDILILPYALGYPVTFTSEGPRVSPHTGSYRKFPSSLFSDRVSRVYQAISNITAKLPKETTLIGFAGAPWTVACYMIEGKNTHQSWIKVKHYALSDPSRFQNFLDYLVESTTTYLIGQIDAGVEVLQLFDTWANAVPAPYFHEWVIHPTQKIVAHLRQERPQIPIIGFIPGCSQWYQKYTSQTGINALSMDSSVTPSWVVQRLPSRLPLQGNLDPAYLLTGGKTMLSQAQQIIQALSGLPHIFNLSHGVYLETPPGHLEILSQWLLEQTSSTRQQSNDGILHPY